MRLRLKSAIGAGLLLLTGHFAIAQSANVDVNLNIRHSVGGISDFGRDRHITMHASLYENAWEDELDQADYLFNELDIQLGRDNGIASFLHQFTPEDENNRNHHDPDSLTVLLNFWKGEYQRRITDRGLLPFKEKQGKGAIMGTNAHPTYPTLSYFDDGLNGSAWGRENGFIWIPQDIETSAAWMVQYLEEFFVENASQDGVEIPEYWEVINEPDFELNTGQFMMSSWEDVMEYHNLVAKGIKEKLGSRAPKIGGMTWGLHDLFRGDGFSRFRDPNYVANFYGNTPADQVAVAYARSQVDTPLFALPSDVDWYQWDVIWKEFLDRAGENMDFYSVHFYDWPLYQNQGGQRRSGGHVEATLEMLEWYDVYKNGKNNRKPVIISEYGAVANAWDPMPHDTRYDWENLKPFSAMMMQFLERPDYIELSMPFHLLKAQFRDIDNNGDGIPEVVYHYKTLRDDDGDGEWERSELVKWYELWDDVDGTRVDTMSSDPDIQVDSYVDGNVAYLILNNLQEEATTINLNFFEDNNNNPSSVRIKHLYLEGVRDIVLSDNTTNNIPSSVTVNPEATMILKYTFPNAVAVNETSVENKFYGEPVSDNQRVNIQGGDNTFFVNNVDVPSNPNQAEAMVKITATLFDAPQTENGFLSLNKFTFNGVEVDVPFDWRGEQQFRSKWFGALEIPVPASLVQRNNTIVVDFQHVGEVNIVNLLTWDFSKTPGRSNPGDEVVIVDATGVNVTPATLTIDEGQTGTLTANVLPQNATNKGVVWSSNNTNVATVNSSGVVTGVNNGNAIITATTNDGNFTDTTNVTVNDGGNQTISVTGVNVTPASLSISEGQTGNLTAGIVPQNASNQAVVWSSNNTNVATVNSSGVVTGVNNGTAIITATTNDGNFTDTTNVTVTSGGGGSVGQNLALNKPATHSSTYLNNNNFSAAAAVDGSLANNNFNHTENDTNAWLQVDLGVVSDITTIEVYNRTNCCINRLSNFHVFVSDTPFASTNLNTTINQSGVGNFFTSGQAGSPTTLNVNRTGRFVRVQLSGTNFLHVKELVVNGTTGNGGGPGGGNDTLVIEAEDFDTTGGTFNDAFAGGPGLGVNDAGANINYVNAGDFATYNINVATAGVYSIEYMISTPSDNAQIQFVLDGVTVATDNVPNNGAWDSFGPLNSSSTVNLSAGSHTIRLNASGSNQWQWNLDKITLQTGTGAKALSASVGVNQAKLFPNPVVSELNFSNVDNFDTAVIYSLNGSKVLEIDLTLNSNVNLSQLSNGIYMVQLNGVLKKEVHKIVVQH
ncbi:Ig-like domain-containing protein [Aquimarina agarilytica]|uniref:Ig-like domain-containing protein n=1 Tax=Aquimarina agarilytica TaxID=1087449 RepID=UPI000289702E|nr:Ig-like domain-containing protein [Aquimarina agarilytica]